MPDWIVSIIVLGAAIAVIAVAGFFFGGSGVTVAGLIIFGGFGILNIAGGYEWRRGRHVKVRKAWWER